MENDSYEGATIDRAYNAKAYPKNSGVSISEQRLEAGQRGVIQQSLHGIILDRREAHYSSVTMAYASLTEALQRAEEDGFKFRVVMEPGNTASKNAPDRPVPSPQRIPLYFEVGFDVEYTPPI